jgi:hypothetical protein
MYMKAYCYWRIAYNRFLLPRWRSWMRRVTAAASAASGDARLYIAVLERRKLNLKAKL